MPTNADGGAPRVDRTVFRLADGRWANKQDREEQPETLHNTREEAVHAAEWLLHHHAGGVLTVLDEAGVTISREPYRLQGGERPLRMDQES